MLFVCYRFLTNVNDVVHIRIEDKKNRDVLSIRSNNSTQMKIPKGVSNVYIDGNVVLKDFHFKSGACYTINVYEDVLGTYVSTYFNKLFLYRG